MAEKDCLNNENELNSSIIGSNEVQSQLNIDNLSSELGENSDISSILAIDDINSEMNPDLSTDSNLNEHNQVESELDIPVSIQGEIPEIPTKLSEFENDVGFITLDDIPDYPEKLSEFVNDGDGSSPFATEDFVLQNAGSGGGGGPTVPVVDNLTSLSTTSALSANQGRVLNEKITEIECNIPTNISELNNDAGFVSKTVSDLENYTTTDKMNEALNNKADRNEIPDISGKVDKSELTDYVSKEELQKENFLKEIPSEYITEEELSSAISNKADKSDIPDISGKADKSEIPDISGLATKTEMQSKSEETLESANDYTDTKVAELIDSAPETLDTFKEIADAFAEDQEVLDTLNSAIGLKADKSEIPDISGKADKSEIPDVSGKADKSELNDYVQKSSVNSSNATKPFDKIPFINSAGVMEVGTYVDFHSDNTAGNDYSTRLYSNGENKNAVKLPSGSGTLALTTDNVSSATKATQDGDGNVIKDTYVKKSGDTMAGNLTVPSLTVSHDGDKNITFTKKDGTIIGKIRGSNDNLGLVAQYDRWLFATKNNTQRLWINPSTQTVYPEQNNAYSLGAPSNVFSTAYFNSVNVPIIKNTSDLGILSDTSIFRFGTSADVNSVAVLAGGSYNFFRPATDNKIDIGTSTQKWKDGYFAGNIYNYGNLAIAGRDSGDTGTYFFEVARCTVTDAYRGAYALISVHDCDAADSCLLELNTYRSTASNKPVVYIGVKSTIDDVASSYWLDKFYCVANYNSDSATTVYQLFLKTTATYQGCRFVFLDETANYRKRDTHSFWTKYKNTSTASGYVDTIPKLDGYASQVIAVDNSFGQVRANTIITNGNKVVTITNETATMASTNTAQTISAVKTFSSAPKISATLATTLNDTTVATTKWIRSYICPAGTVVAFAGSTTPSGWLLCDGSAVSRTTYSALYSAIGTNYGAGNGSTTFNIPKLTDNRFIEGSSSSPTSSTERYKEAGVPNIQGVFAFTVRDGSAKGAFSWGSVDHSKIGTGSSYDTKQAYFNASTGDTGKTTTTTTTYNTTSVYGKAETVQPKSLIMRYIIKY